MPFARKSVVERVDPNALNHPAAHAAGYKLLVAGIEWSRDALAAFSVADNPTATGASRLHPGHE